MIASRIALVILLLLFMVGFVALIKWSPSEPCKKGETAVWIEAGNSGFIDCEKK